MGKGVRKYKLINEVDGKLPCLRNFETGGGWEGCVNQVFVLKMDKVEAGIMNDLTEIIPCCH